MARFNVAILATSLAALAQRATSDLPVHCLRHQVEGEWNFVLGDSSKTRSSCGHAHPDTEDAQPGREVMRSGTSKLVELRSPNLVRTKEGQRGTWTMVYDEGFEVKVGDHTFFAFSNFTFQRDPLTHEKKNFSHCGDTMVGWFHNTDRTEFGCYFASKVQPEAPVPLPASKTVASKTAQDRTMTHTAMTQKVARLNARLNMLQLGWKAGVVKKWIGKTVREINRYAGIRRTAPARELHRDMMLQATAGRKHSRPSFLQRSRPARLPAAWDWSNASGGMDWLEPVMDQSDCGSCYAASSMRMLSTRHKIKQNNASVLPWSINMPLFCGEYNQGCKGGYPFLMSKWSSEVGLVPATCMRYNTAGTCKLECDLDKLEGKRYRSDNYRYVGSFYGNASTEAIMEELYENGPMVVSFEPAEDFMYYSDGVYKSEGLHNQTAKPEWEKVDHAVLLVGYGEDDGTPYWRIQNSWGPDWGEDGFFRMVRGRDESGIESIAVAADVVEDPHNGRHVKDFFDGLEQKQKKKAA